MTENNKNIKAYTKRSLLRHGDIRKIAQATGFSYIYVVKQLNGERNMTIAVKECADALTSEHLEFIETIKKEITQS